MIKSFKESVINQVIEYNKLKYYLAYWHEEDLDPDIYISTCPLTTLKMLLENHSKKIGEMFTEMDDDDFARHDIYDNYPDLCGSLYDYTRMYNYLLTHSYDESIALLRFITEIYFEHTWSHIRIDIIELKDGQSFHFSDRFKMIEKINISDK